MSTPPFARRFLGGLWLGGLATAALALVGAPPVRRPIVAIRRTDSGSPMGPVADFLALLRKSRAAA